VLAERAHLPGRLLAGRMRIHIVGAGGAGMSAIATLLAEMGHEVSGSDRRSSPALARLASSGVRTSVGHHEANLGRAELVAHSTAVEAGNVELVKARALGLPVLSRGELLAAICGARRTLAVSGSHGKTTTTAMLVAVLAAAGTEPSFLIGGDPVGGKPAAAWRGGEWLVAEADESDGTFLALPTEAVVVTSVEADHLDHFGDLGALEAAFVEFAGKAAGPKVVCLDDAGAARVAVAVGGTTRVVTYGTAEAATYRVTGVELSRSSAAFSVDGPAGDLGRFSVPVPGRYNVLNAAASIAMGAELGLPVSAARSALGSYQPVARRFERKGESGGVTYVDDYAHNPGKIRAVLAGAREGGWERVVAVFQPHRYSRTAALWRELGNELSAADIVVVTGIYAAGEAPRPEVSGRLVADAAREARSGVPVYYVEDRSELIGLLRGLLRPGDLCLTMSAGDLTDLPAQLLVQKEATR
jgi:UDP-N-acetylmuramate--alanine ligase